MTPTIKSKSVAISASYPNLSTFSFPIKATRSGGFISLTNGGFFRPDHRKVPAGLSCTTQQSRCLNDSHYRGRTEAFNTKIGLSIRATIGCCSLCDELTSFVCSDNDRPLLDRLRRTAAPATRIFSLLPQRDYLSLSVAMCIYSSV